MSCTLGHAWLIAPQTIHLMEKTAFLILHQKKTKPTKLRIKTDQILNETEDK